MVGAQPGSPQSRRPNVRRTHSRPLAVLPVVDSSSGHAAPSPVRPRRPAARRLPPARLRSDRRLAPSRPSGLARTRPPPPARSRTCAPTAPPAPGRPPPAR
ncbi:hypothetical protein GUJ93_ZPchr0010g8766 [Zizania palustris]|uniref:Uncharacterized protein n=1 Tax=Zizania palustris TaxID=103762 RepID=A0A8J6BMU5_ZIZPA|nr:hypothetical protein GUJ93_ZPchr0010g8766 [Zizania palustris]